MSDMQVSKSFDPKTIERIKKSALISLGGFVVATIPMLVPDILEMVKGYPVLTALIGSTAPFLVNTVREWLAGQSS